MNWDDIRIFLSVARKGSLTGAAETLGMSTSSTGRHIDHLEAKLGIRLFIRSQTGLTLSEAGIAIIADAEIAEEALDALQRKAPGIASTVTGIVRIAMPDNFASELILPQISAFHVQYPHVQLELVTSVNVANLTRREADIGLRLIRPDNGNFVMMRVGTMATALYASHTYLSSHPFDTASEGDGHVLISWVDTFRTLKAVRWLDATLPRATIAVRASTLQSQLAACVADLGLATLPCFMADAVPGLVRLREPSTVFSQDIWLVTHHDIRDTARIRITVAFLRSIVQANRSRLLGIGQ